MKYATLTSLGGMIISAEEADHNTYKGYLCCLECKELVFYRDNFIKSNGKQVLSTFVHFKKDKEVAEVCELRVKSKSNELKGIYELQKKQRLTVLRTQLWQYLKTGSSISLKTYRKDMEMYVPCKLRYYSLNICLLKLEL